MTTPDRRGPMGRLRSRLRLLELGVLLPVLVTGVLGVAYLKALMARQEAVEAGARLLARRVLDRTVALASVRGDEAARSILLPVTRLARATPEAALDAMGRATDSLRACQCGPLKEGEFRFVAVPGVGQPSLVVPGPTRRDPAGLMAGLTFKGLPPAGSIWAMTGSDSAGPWLLHLTSVRLADGTLGVAGFDISIDSWWNGTFLPAAGATAREFFSATPHPDSAFALALWFEGQVLRRSGTSALGVTEQVPLPAVPGYQLAVGLNPAVLPMVLAAAAPPAYPVLIGALGATLLVSVLAMMLLRQVRRTLAQREAFVASISHELRTPLTEMLLHAESLELNRNTPAAKERAAGAIVRETRRLIGLVENALALAGAGRSGPGPATATSLGPVLRTAVAALAGAAENRRVRLDVTVEDSVVAAVEPMAFDRIVTNLVENAIRYGPEGQTVRVRLHPVPGGTVLAVDDEGPGISPGERRRIFEPFERGAAARGSAAAGVGLGLAIVQHLVTAAGGTVRVEDAAAGGARFVVSLPAPGS